MELIYLLKFKPVLLYLLSLSIKCSAGDDVLLFAHVVIYNTFYKFPIKIAC